MYGVLAEGDMSPDSTGEHSSGMGVAAGGVVRSRTLPTSRRRGGGEVGDKEKDTVKERGREKERERSRVLKKKRSSVDKTPLQTSTGANTGGGVVPPDRWTQQTSGNQNQEWTLRADG